MSLLPVPSRSVENAVVPFRALTCKPETHASSMAIKKRIQFDRDESYRSRMQAILYFTLQPVFTVSLNLASLVERESLVSYVKKNQTDVLLKALCVPEKGKTSHLYLRVYPNSSGNTYELIDTEARDLYKCQYVFSRILGYGNAQAVLYQFSSPSFSGKKAMTLVWNIMAITGIRNMLFTDVSTMLSCCDEGALTSLHLAEVITKGKSWYCTQGATPKIIAERFQVVFHTEFIEGAYNKFLSGDLKDKRITLAKKHPQNYELFASEYLKFYLEGHASEDAYLQAALFLYSIKSVDLQTAITQLSSKYPQLKEVQNLLEKTERSSTSKVSEELQDLLQKGLGDHGVVHQRMHDMRDYIVSNKGSVFFQYIIDKLQELNGNSDAVGITLAFLILDNFFKKLKGLNDPVLKSYLEHPEPERLEQMMKESHTKLRISQVLYNILNPDLNKQQNIKHVTEKLCTAFLQMIENRPSSPVSAKICNNSHKSSREKWVNYSEATGAVDDLVACQSAVSYLASLPLLSIKAIYPELIEMWEERYPYAKEHAWRLTIADLIDALRLDEQGVDAIFDDLFRGAIRHMSTLSMELFKNYEKNVARNPKHAYELFMIAKYLCRRKEYFALYL